MSKILLSPYVNLQGRAREAMEFYQQALGGRVELQTMTEQGEVKPAGAGDWITEARLECDGALIVGTDGNPKFTAKIGEILAIALVCSVKECIITNFLSLVEGVLIKGPLAEQSY